MIKVAIMGHGTVGSGVYEVFDMNADKIASNENTALDEKSQIAETIRAIDDFYRQADELYRQTAWRMGPPDCAFDIVYALVNEDGLTQKQLCELGFSSKQTVHSSIKRMVDKGVVELRGDTPALNAFI